MDESLSAEKVYKDLLWQDRGRQSGAVCFYGTRVPVAQFFESLEVGESLDDFDAAFPHVGRDRLVAVLQLGLSDIIGRLEAA